MHHPISLPCFEGMDPQSLTPSSSLFASHGCNLQLESAPLSKREQSHYQAHIWEEYSHHEEELFADEDTHLILERLRELGYLG